MRPFRYTPARSAPEAVRAAAGEGAVFLAGGTTLLDLMKLEALTPQRVVDLRPLRQTCGKIRSGTDGLHLGALVTMSQAQEHSVVARDYPVIARSLALAASPQLRNMATLGGNVLQRTRCNYFRNPGWAKCNKRNPGSGCAAMGGVNRLHAVLGTSEHCIASYPGDFAIALVALNAQVDVLGPSGERRIAFAELHREPGEAPHDETVLAPSELITGFFVPDSPCARRSVYVKVRDRESFEFALASAAVAMDLEGDRVRQVHIGLGGVATKPWRATEAEQVLIGQTLSETTMQQAACAAFGEAVTHGQNDFKPELGRRTLVRALQEARALP